MTNREELIAELKQAPDDLIPVVLDFLNRVKAARKNHPLGKYAGIISDAEAEELQEVITKDCRQVDVNEW